MKSNNTDITLKNLNLLYVNSNDQMGQRFSGIDWLNPLQSAGFSPRMLIGRSKQSNDSRIASFRDRTPKLIKNASKYIERQMGTQSNYSPTLLEMLLNKDFRNADLVHYQVIHDGSWFRLESLQALSKKKPSVWTWHDAWPITGHCIQPLNCSEFFRNCSTCPHLDWPMTLTRDTAKSERLRKARIVNKSKINIHVTTKWMQNLITASGNFDNLKIKVLPFGVDTKTFKPDKKLASRAKFGIDRESFVIGIRASDWIVKNTPLFIQTMQSLDPASRKVDVLIYEKVDALWDVKNLHPNIQIHDLGWLEEKNLIETYRCLDIFLGISTGESFGFMPLEASACGAIPISLDGTAVSEFVAKIDPCLIVKNTKIALKETIQALINDSELVRRMADKTQEIVLRDYTLEKFLINLEEYYLEVIEDFEND